MNFRSAKQRLTCAAHEFHYSARPKVRCLFYSRGFLKLSYNIMIIKETLVPGRGLEPRQ
jgi:hypothetical protein